MSAPEEQAEGVAEPLLRMYRGDGDELDGPGDAVDDLDENPSSKPLEAEVEAFWAGRSPANRHSARVAA
jgi:hypothetical protein